MPNKPHFISVTSRPMFVLIAIGLILMLGIILASENLNSIFQTDQPVQASAQKTLPVSPTIQTPSAPIVSSPITTSPDPVGSLMSDPKNFRVVPVDIKPAQAVIEGKTIKFLMGF